MGDQVSGSGAFVAVVGPSGAGKDSVLLEARARLVHSGVAQAGVVPPHFARRAITRLASVGEDHVPLTEAGFAASHDRGEYALTWNAHGLRYGIPRTECAALRAGVSVVANLSREVLPVLPGVFSRPFTVLITVSPEVRAARISARGREAGAEAVARMARPDPAPDFAYDLTIVNDSTIEQAGAQLASFLRELGT